MSYFLGTIFLVQKQLGMINLVYDKGVLLDFVFNHRCLITLKTMVHQNCLDGLTFEIIDQKLKVIDF